MTGHTGSTQEKLTQCGSDPDIGLTEQEAGQRLEKYGENKLLPKKHLNLFMKFLLQLKDVMVIILLLAAAASFVVALLEQSGNFLDSIIILYIVILNAVLGVVQEHKAEKSLDALQSLAAPTAKVLREGQVRQMPSAKVVPGDIVLLEAGDFVPADLRLLESASLKCEESALTGESVPADKDAGATVDKEAPLGDRYNMAYAGCSVVYGRAKGLIVSTGMHTEMGRIAELLNQEEDGLTPLQQRLARMGKQLGLLVLVICAGIFGLGLFQGMDLMEIFMTAVSLAVAAIPEGMTAVVTVVLALGVQRMVKKNAIIRRLPAVETLGSATVICSDKTGTLTQNRMTVRKVWAVEGNLEDLSPELGEGATHVLRLGTMCNDGQITQLADEEQRLGDPTETAIVAAAAEVGIDKSELDETYPRLGEIPFDSDRKCMTTIHRVGDKILAVVKGGYDIILPKCRNTVAESARLINSQMGENALRVLAVACRELSDAPASPTPEELERELVFMGLIGMIDPPRQESREAVLTCKGAGIKTVMITGDHVSTAGAVARELGILGQGDAAISGSELQALSQEELEEQVERYSVYARVSPEDKIRIVKAWQRKGAVVAMTGDGVNDAPALKAADIGCAMGITGTDVAKQAADMVLTDDNFTTIVEAVRQGRGIYSNIKKTVQFLLGCNLGEVFAVFFAMLLGWGTPLLAIHLLMINLVTDTLPALALGVEPIEQGIMKNPPISKEEGLFSGGTGIVILLQGVLVGSLTLAAYYIGSFVSVSPYFVPSHAIGMTMAFLVLAASQLTQALNCRSNASLFQIGFFTNKAMVRGIGISILILLLITLVPALERIFKLVELSMIHWIIVLCLALAPLLVTETAKALISLKKRIV